MFLIEEIKIPTLSQNTREGWGNPAVGIMFGGKKVLEIF
jgi:hypothetical protein